MNSLLVAGDVHGNVSHLRYLLDVANRKGATYLFQLGDFGYWPHTADGRAFLRDVEKFATKASCTVWFLDGNHDRSSLIDRAVTDDDGFVVISENVRYAPRGHRWTWDDVRFIALGGAFSVDKPWRVKEERAKAHALEQKAARYGSTKSTDTTGTLWFPEEELTDAELAAALADSTPVDVMLTHDKPRASDPRWNRKDVPECWPNQDRIQRAVTALRPRLLVHGHLHYPYRDQIRSGTDSWTTVIGLDADPSAAEHPGYSKSDSWMILDLAEVARGTAAAAGGVARMSDMDIPERLAPAYPGEWPGKERLAAFEAYRAELGLTADELPMTHNRVNEGVRWWSAGAPMLDREPTPQSIMLAQLDGWLATGATWPEGGIALDEFRERMHKGDRENRVTRAAPRPDRPRSPRSKHATAATTARCRRPSL